MRNDRIHYPPRFLRAINRTKPKDLIMRQVPRYLLIGNGRVGRHFQHYFSLLSIPFLTWQRSEPVVQLQRKLHKSSHVLILIADDAIEQFIGSHLQDISAIRLHFSGSLVTDAAYGIHPLMSFSQHLYTLEHYQAIPFVIDHDAPAFDILLPGLPNQHVRLHKILKPKYHALCVMSGNFSCLLWQKLFFGLENEFHLPMTIAQPYFKQHMKNLLEHPHTALTGPLARGDIATIEKNIAALEDDPFQKIYQSFVEELYPLLPISLQSKVRG